MKRDSFPIGLTGIFGLLILWGMVQINYGANKLVTTVHPLIEHKQQQKFLMPQTKHRSANPNFTIWHLKWPN